MPWHSVRRTASAARGSLCLSARLGCDLPADYDGEYNLRSALAESRCPAYEMITRTFKALRRRCEPAAHEWCYGSVGGSENPLGPASSSQSKQLYLRQHRCLLLASWTVSGLIPAPVAIQSAMNFAQSCSGQGHQAHASIHHAALQRSSVVLRHARVTDRLTLTADRQLRDA